MKDVKNRLNNRPTFIPQKFTKPSLTIPGQQMTPQEIMRQYVKGVDKIQRIFSEHPIDQFQKSDKFSRMDMMRRNNNFIEELKADIIDKSKKPKPDPTPGPTTVPTPGPTTDPTPGPT